MDKIADGDTYRITWRRGKRIAAAIEQTYNEELETVDVSVKYPDGRRKWLVTVEVR